MDIDITAALTYIVDQVKAAGVVDVTADPGKVRLPGVLVQLSPTSGIELDTLDGYSLHGRVLVISPDRDDPRAVEALQELLGQVLDANVEVTGPITPTGVQLPAQTTPMPGLAIPVRVHVTPEEPTP